MHRIACATIIFWYCSSGVSIVPLPAFGSETGSEPSLLDAGVDMSMDAAPESRCCTRVADTDASSGFVVPNAQMIDCEVPPDV